MKKIQIATMLLMLGLFAITGCTPSSGGGGAVYYFKATSSSGPSVNTTTTVASVAGTNLGLSCSTVTGSVGGPPFIAISIPHWTGGVGSWVFIENPTVDDAFGQYTPTAGDSKMSKSGSVTITAVTPTDITGKFEFTCTDGTVISGGTFNVQRY